jgi:hypothetical protein
MSHDSGFGVHMKLPHQQCRKFLFPFEIQSIYLCPIAPISRLQISTESEIDFRFVYLCLVVTF